MSIRPTLSSYTQAQGWLGLRRILILLLFVLALPVQAFALGECGLSCCLMGAVGSGVTLADKFSVSLQYEYTFMGTIKKGSSEISPDQVLQDKIAEGASRFIVPTQMVMQKYSLIAAYPATPRLSLIGILPYVINDMDMRQMTDMGMTMDMEMERVQGLGDIAFMGLYTLYQDAPIRPSSRLTAGIGLKIPSGSNTERTSNGQLIHAMMQPGTGSWDPLFFFSVYQFLNPVGLQVNFLYHLATRGDEGYEFGDQLTVEALARYQILPYVNIGVGVSSIFTGQDTDHEGKYSRPDTSLIDNPLNTGLTSISFRPELQVKIPNTGGNVQVRGEVPIYQSGHGLQQVMDWRIFGALTWNF